jgi:bis(5'-adenosyl)-triphosphatase
MDNRGGSDAIYEIMESPEGNIGQHQRESERNLVNGNHNDGSKLVAVDADDRKPRAIEAMQEEAEWLRREMEKEGP